MEDRELGPMEQERRDKVAMDYVDRPMTDTLQQRLRQLDNDFGTYGLHGAISRDYIHEVLGRAADALDAKDARIADLDQRLDAALAVNARMVTQERPRLDARIAELEDMCREFVWGEEHPGEYKSEMTKLRAQIAELDIERCDECGSHKLIEDCLRCGAPNCCSVCCHRDYLMEQIAEIKSAENEQCKLVAQDLEKAQARVEELEETCKQYLARDWLNRLSKAYEQRDTAQQRLRDVVGFLADYGSHPNRAGATAAIQLAGFTRCECGGSGQIRKMLGGIALHNEATGELWDCPCVQTNTPGWVVNHD